MLISLLKNVPQRPRNHRHNFMVDLEDFKSTFDLAKFSSDEFKNELFMAVSAPYMNEARDEKDPPTSAQQFDAKLYGSFVRISRMQSRKLESP